MSSVTRYKLEQALLYIENNLDNKLSAQHIAQHACLSSFHFQHMFSAYLGESVNQYVLHRRLEKSAHKLITEPKLSIIDIALNSGFETHSAFSRAFKSHFGSSPSKFRLQPTQISSSLDTSRPFLKTTPTKTSQLEFNITTLPTLFYNYKMEKGTTNGTFLKQSQHTLAADFKYLSQQDVFGVISAFPASPKSLNDQEAQILYGGLYLEQSVNNWSAQWLALKSGLWATFEHRGSYDYLYQTWNQAFRSWLPRSGFELRDTLPFEMYLTSPQTTPEKNWLTKLYIPIKTAG